ncbi:HAD family hydrolase [Brachybacterium kimchii]|uniref:HAD family hydrolase n=1 Tax=Brachybacterium kimchii TaxID=2942909 RepID=A0ABY4N5S5_9MICO|nr:HAD family hydrolase [Brachybacterium kimchii]UQN28684.1 HAD family hydrolase [Brachybacterium kimchii]
MVDRIRTRAVILDLDDTLFDHRTSARAGLAHLVEELGETPSDEIADAWEATAVHLMARRRAGEIDRAEYRRERVRHLVDDLRLDDPRRPGGPRPAGDPHRLADAECDAFYDRFLTLYEQEWRAFDDVLPTLRALDDLRLPVAVLTNGPELRQQKKMRALGLRDLVVGVWTSEGIGAAKPDPASYLTVCAAVDLEPTDVLHVGDNPEHDLRGAQDAGLRALHLDRRGEAGVGGADAGGTRIRVLGQLLDHL